MAATPRRDQPGAACQEIPGSEARAVSHRGRAAPPGQGSIRCSADQSETPFTLAAIGLLILTGARLTEILTLRCEHLDLRAGVPRLPDSKTGAKLIYLNDAAIHLLRSMPRMQGNRYVIAGKKTGARLIDLQKPGALRAKANLPDVRIHGLRRSFASVAVGVGMSLPMIGKLLGHTQAAITHRYVHLATDRSGRPPTLIGNEISAVMTGTKPRASGPPSPRQGSAA